ncbi:hypothetical protein BJ742DRAFT_780333 [Cladochytrium replicatum]|nr:hypothetical protein BJ742DRAFT_780333 [Cladochytrium replicatum]
MRPVPPRSDMNVYHRWNQTVRQRRTGMEHHSYCPVDAVYVFPTDAGEGGRQAIKHRLVKHIFGGPTFVESRKRGLNPVLRCSMSVPDNSFDYVHQRFFTFSIPGNCWNHVISELLRVVKPGGWIDIMEQEPVLRNLTPRVQALYKAHQDSFAARGLDFSIPRQLDEMIRTDPRFELAVHERKTQTLYEDTEVSKLWREDHMGWF